MRVVTIRALVFTVLAVAAGPSPAAVTQVEGQAGGGIVPWALLSGGLPTVSTTWVDTGDYTLSSIAVQAGLLDRVELSLARVAFDPGEPHAITGHIRLDVLGAKVNVLPMTDTLPAVSLGVQLKRMDGDAIIDGLLDSMGANDRGVDVYLAATKVLPFIQERKFLFNATVRATKANQIGLLGFGSSEDNGYKFQFEGSAGVFLNDQTVFGVEYRMKPDNELNNGDGGIRWNENDWGDVFFAYFPTKNMALVAAAAMFGDIAPVAGGTPGNGGNGQRGLYFQVQANF